MAQGLSTNSGLFSSHLPGKDLSAVTGVGSRAKIFFRPCVSSSSWVTLYTKVGSSSEDISHGCDLKCFRSDAQKSVPYTEVILALAAKEAAGNKKKPELYPEISRSVDPRLDHSPGQTVSVPPADRQSCALEPAFTNMSAVGVCSLRIYFRGSEGAPASSVTRLTCGGCLGSLLRSKSPSTGPGTEPSNAFIYRLSLYRIFCITTLKLISSATPSSVAPRKNREGSSLAAAEALKPRTTQHAGFGDGEGALLHHMSPYLHPGTCHLSAGPDPTLNTTVVHWDVWRTGEDYSRRWKIDRKEPSPF